jgi:hypothetical protein
LPGIDVAQTAITAMGRITREFNANPVAVAVGMDADGVSCAKFAGSRGYNCFFKYTEDLKQTSEDVINGIKCNYHMLTNGEFVPVEADNHFYYVGDASSASADTVKPTRHLVEKYLNLVLQKHINDIKNVIDPIKESMNSMKHFNKLNFNDTHSIDINNFLLFYLIFGKTFFRGCSLSSDEDETSDKESSDNSELSSE